MSAREGERNRILHFFFLFKKIFNVYFFQYILQYWCKEFLFYSPYFLLNLRISRSQINITKKKNKKEDGKKELTAYELVVQLKYSINRINSHTEIINELDVVWNETNSKISYNFLLIFYYYFNIMNEFSWNLTLFIEQKERNKIQQNTILCS